MFLLRFRPLFAPSPGHAAQQSRGQSPSPPPSLAEADLQQASSSIQVTGIATPPGPSPAPPTRSISDLLGEYTPRKVLENSGSTARDHLASERTFLAYVRTSLALASTGVALVQLFTIADLTSRGNGTPLSEASKRVQKFARPLGVTTVLLALAVLCIAAHRYFLVQRCLPENKFPIARLSIAFISFVLGAVVAVIFGALLGGKVSG